MDLTRVAEIIESTFKKALYEPQYRFGIGPNSIGGTSDKVASGSLYKSIEALPSKDGIFIFMNSYGKFVNKGRQPGKYVPIKPLEEWVKERGLSWKDKNGKAMSSKTMAIIISKNIKNVGIPALPFGWMDYAIEQLYSNKDLENLLVEMTVDDLLNKIQGI
jgi:hypothetical protein